MLSFSLVILCLVNYGASSSVLNTKIVLTKQGKVEGSLSENGLYYEFCGIRYGVPVKFRAPTEPPSYDGIYKANVRTVICAQFPTTDPLTAPSDTEDCLILNVFVPAQPSNATIPVMVFLHGGDFGVGSSSPSFYDPQYLVSQDVVIVTVNYRLNVYGFLNLGTKDAPGNAGLKDIRQALRWIKSNIRNFGGDDANVTVFGQGSGGIAAIYLMLSQSTKGLFHRIISQSGSVFSPQSFDANPLTTASQVAKSLGLSSKKPKDLLKLYSNTPIKVIEEGISKQMNPKSVFLPSIETDHDSEEPFLVDSPYNILNTGKEHSSFNPVPVICGLNTVEGMTCTLEYYTITSQIDRIMNGDYSAIDQRNMNIPKEEKDDVRKILQDTYFANVTDSEETVVGGLINMNTDFSFVGPMALFSEMFSAACDLPIYVYVFDYIGNRNLGRLLTNTSLDATTNQDELFYLFELQRLPLPMDENDARIVNFMTIIWTNFAKYGTPTPDTENGEWLPHPYSLAISLEPDYVNPLTPERARFWKYFFEKYGVETEK